MQRSNDPCDTDLLHAFSALMDERSLSRAATRLQMSSYAVGTALERLRVIFGDPLLLRDGQRLVPTERALQLEASLQTESRTIHRMRGSPSAGWSPSRRPAARLVR